MTHPLNKIWPHAVLLRTDWKWNPKLGCFEAGYNYKEYVLGDRSIDQVFGDRTFYECYSINDIGYFGYYGRLKNIGRLSFNEALNWLKQASHSEYGCRLWCIEETQ